ncbi:hypothetical protein [Duganella sp. S19_KUP01_CR8]|uniref:hypothetical protein n=1 Tax=Duganella sp. S19_KUP01_CR8 TaxID=3025502 RepID=UPI002FCDCBCF
MNNHLLTDENAFNGAGFNKMPNPQADLFPNKINGLHRVKFKPQTFSGPLEKYFFVHK